MTTTTQVYVYAFARTPFGRFGGALADYDPGVLGALAIDEVVRRSSVPPSSIGAVYAGTGMIGDGLLTPARQAVLRSSLPPSTPSVGIDRACCSGMSALAAAAADIRNGEARAIVAGGFESLSRVPRTLKRTFGADTGALSIDDPLLLASPFSEGTIARYTSEEALKAGVDRVAQDDWAATSHERYFAAHDTGYFDTERFAVPAQLPQKKRQNSSTMLASDESPRRDSTRAALAALSAVRGSETITAGNAPGLNDGAAFVVLGDASLEREFGCRPLARIVGHARVAESPTSGTRTPATAIQTVLDRAQLSVEQLALIEINEAFAATPLVSTLMLARGDIARAAQLRQRTNVNGGAVAIGHPMGASGARIVMTLVNALRRRGGGFGAAAICGGFGQGEALLLHVDT